MVIVCENTDAAAAGINMGMVRGGNLIFTAICGMHNEGQKWHCREALTNVIAHSWNFTETVNGGQLNQLSVKREKAKLFSCGRAGYEESIGACICLGCTSLSVDSLVC